MANEQMCAGVIGLGIMGGEFARHLTEAGVPVTGFDVLPIKLQGVQTAGSPSELGKTADIVITSLPHPKALDEALFGESGVVKAGRRDLIVVETSTFSLETKKAARVKLAEVGIQMLDAPVSGTGAQAKNKDIAIFASGDRSTFDRAQSVLTHFSRSVRYTGEFGTGSKLKYIANLLIAIHTMATAEAMALGEKAGIDPATLVDVIGDSAAKSRMFEVRAPHMVDGSYTTPMMKVDVFQKDLDIIADFAQQTLCPVPLFTASIPYYIAARAQGMGGWDIGAVHAVLQNMARKIRQRS